MSGPLLGGKYRLGEQLGAGGMAVVHAAVNVLTDREVAIKQLLPRFADDPTFVGRFGREARAVGRVKSPHVVDVLDVGHDEAGLPFIVMERLHGEPLSAKLRRQGALPPVEALDVCIQMLTGVAAAHAAGVVHRDLKPGNVFVEQGDGGRPVVKLVDFGISKVAGIDEATALTKTGDALGSYPYMAPEQIRSSATAGPAVDIWATGIVLHRLLTGSHPFPAEESLALVAMILEARHESLEAHGLAPSLSAALQPLVDRALAKDPAARFASALEMRAALTQAQAAISHMPEAHAARAPGPLGSTRPLSIISTASGRPLTAPQSADPPSTAPVQTSSSERAAADRTTLWAGLGAVVLGAGLAALLPIKQAGAGACVEIDVTPRDAQLEIDGSPVQRGACIAPGPRPSKLTAKASGHRPVELVLPKQTPSRVVIVLAGEASRSATANTAAPPAPPPAEPTAPEPSAQTRPAPPATQPAQPPAAPKAPSRPAGKPAVIDKAPY